MRVFVATATGVIGRALIPRLVKAGHEAIRMSNDQSTGGLLRTWRPIHPRWRESFRNESATAPAIQRRSA